MGYIAWSDGSLCDNKAYVSFKIQKEGKVVSEFVGFTEKLKSSYHSECVAFYLLIKEIKRLKINGIEIFNDCQSLVNDFKKGQKKKKNLFPFRDYVFVKLGETFCLEIIKKMKWKRRCYNFAHIKKSDRVRACKIEIPKKMEVFFKVKEEKNNKTEKDVLEIYKKIENFKELNVKNIIQLPESHFNVSKKVFDKFKKSVCQSKKYETDQDILNLLHKKIRSSMLVQIGDLNALITGSLHLFVKKGIIYDILVNQTRWSKNVKEKSKKASFEIKLKSIRKIEEVKGPTVTLPNNGLTVECKIINRFLKTIPNSNDIALAAVLFSEKIESSLKIKENGYEVFVNGRLHIYVANNLVQEYKIYESKWTKLSKEM